MRLTESILRNLNEGDDILNKDIEVYDLDSYIQKEEPDWETHTFNGGAAILVKSDGSGCMVDYEAVGYNFKSIDRHIEIGLHPHKEPEGNKIPIYPVATATIELTPREIIENAPHKTMKVKDFFTKYNYNDRCSRNFEGIKEYLTEDDILDDSVDRFAKDLETTLIDSDCRVDTKDYRYFGVSKGDAKMLLVIYEASDVNSPIEGKDSIGISSSDESDYDVSPIYPDDSWDYETGEPSGARPEVGKETYAIFKALDETSVQEVVNIVKEAFNRANKENGAFTESDNKELKEHSIFGFKEFSDDYLFYSEANSHAILLLKGLEEYYEKMIDAANSDAYAFQGIEDLKSLEDALSHIQMALKCIRKSSGDE